MTVSYNRLWKRLIDLNMSKTQLREKAGITTNAMAKMGKNENVSTEIICKICKVLECQVEDVIELVDDEAEKAKLAKALDKMAKIEQSIAAFSK